MRLKWLKQYSKVRPGQYRSYRNKALLLIAFAALVISVLAAVFQNNLSIGLRIFISIGTFFFLYLVIAGMFLMAQFIHKLQSVNGILRILNSLKKGDPNAAAWGLAALFNSPMPVHKEILEQPPVMYLLGFLLKEFEMPDEAEMFLSRADLDEELSVESDPFQYLISAVEELPCYKLYRKVWDNRFLRVVIIVLFVLFILLFYIVKAAESLK